MVGASHQPIAVISDLKTLGTLPRREISSGLAEIIKRVLLDSPESFASLEKNFKQLMKLEPKTLMHTIRHSCGIKARIIAEDKKSEAANEHC